MSIKMKLAALAALTALTSSAFAAGFVTAGDSYDAIQASTDLRDNEGLVVAAGGDSIVFADAAGNSAVVNQLTSSNFAYVEQTLDVGNYAIVSQSVADSNAASVFQSGSANKAMVFQH